MERQVVAADTIVACSHQSILKVHRKQINHVQQYDKWTLLPGHRQSPALQANAGKSLPGAGLLVNLKPPPLAAQC